MNKLTNLNAFRKTSARRRAAEPALVCAWRRDAVTGALVCRWTVRGKPQDVPLCLAA
jgi:hypothetical protein